MRLADAFEVGEERLLLAEPLVERRPRLEQRLVCHLDQWLALLLVCAAARRQQPRLGERTDEAKRLLRQFGAPRGLANALAVIEPHPHEMRHKRVAQRRQLTFARLYERDCLVGGEPDRILDWVETSRRIAESLVFVEAQFLVGAAALVEQ